MQAGMGKEGTTDPRIKMQREKTGLEYLVVRRYRDPVGASLKRLGVRGEQKERDSVRGHGHGQGMAMQVGEKERARIRELERERERAKGRDSGLSGTPGSGGVVWGAGKGGGKDGKGGGNRGHRRGKESVDSVAGSGMGQEDGAAERRERGEVEQEEDKLRVLLQGLWEKGVEVGEG